MPDPPKIYSVGHRVHLHSRSIRFVATPLTWAQVGWVHPMYAVDCEQPYVCSRISMIRTSQGHENYSYHPKQTKSVRRSKRNAFMEICIHMTRFIYDCTATACSACCTTDNRDVAAGVVWYGLRGLTSHSVSGQGGRCSAGLQINLDHLGFLNVHWYWLFLPFRLRHNAAGFEPTAKVARATEPPQWVQCWWRTGCTPPLTACSAHRTADDGMLAMCYLGSRVRTLCSGAEGCLEHSKFCILYTIHSDQEILRIHTLKSGPTMIALSRFYCAFSLPPIIPLIISLWCHCSTH